MTHENTSGLSSPVTPEKTEPSRSIRETSQALLPYVSYKYEIIEINPFPFVKRYRVYQYKIKYWNNDNIIENRKYIATFKRLEEAANYVGWKLSENSKKIVP